MAASVTIERPCLYLVATPIGNLADISQRALHTLESVDILLAEDTRNSQKLLSRYGIARAMEAYHAHNEAARAAEMTERARTQRLAIALISDAGSPMISDPGWRLAQAFITANLPVRVVPGPSAVIAALLSSGLAVERFAFEGFLAAKTAARKKQLVTLKHETRALVFFEAPHRVADTLCDIEEIMGATRQLALLRELTKLYETAYRGTVAEVRRRILGDPHGQVGEMVIVVAPAAGEEPDAEDASRVLSLLLPHVSNKVAVELAAKITRTPRNSLYAMAMALRDGEAGLPAKK